MDILRKPAQLGLQIWSNPFHCLQRPPIKREQELIDELRCAFAHAPEVSADGESEAVNRWVQFQKRLRSLVLSRDPREFLSWDVISKTMFLAFSPYAVREVIHLKRQNNWNSRWKDALQESPVGRPAPFLLYPQTSANLIHDAYNLYAFQEATGLVPEQFHNILEFGGGDWSLCPPPFQLPVSCPDSLLHPPTLFRFAAPLSGSFGYPF